VKRDLRGLDLALGIITVAALILTLTVTWVVVSDDGDTWSPLGPYPVQQIDTVVTAEHPVNENEQIPVWRISAGDVPVTGEKCTSEPVETIGDWGWSAVEPPGGTFDQGSGLGLRPGGCEPLDFRNPIPDDVAARTIEAGQHVWRINGCDTPVDDDGKEGATLCWRTQDFLLVP
jgi:hypothetical protein